jgi:N-acetylmuramoyl-L-alanine amidase
MLKSPREQVRVLETNVPHRFVPSPNVEPRKDGLTATILLLHYTGMTSAEKACDWLCREESRVSCHYLVDELGNIVQMVDEAMRAWHAGESSWRGATDINSMSIGIEIQNTGHTGLYEDFSKAQMTSVIALSHDIVARHNIRPERVLAHSDVAPGRKIDPGEKFDWALLSQRGVGHWVEPVALGGGQSLQWGDQGDKVTALQGMFALYGYGLDATGIYDTKTLQVVTAFQRHFRPARVDGVADQSTIETLFRLTAALPLGN